MLFGAMFVIGLATFGYTLVNDPDRAWQAYVANWLLLVDRDGTVYRYTVCAPVQGMLFAAIGGLFLGMISVGLAELQEYRLVARCRIPTPVAVGTSIFVVVVTVLFASLLVFLCQEHCNTSKTVGR